MRKLKLENTAIQQLDDKARAIVEGSTELSGTERKDPYSVKLSKKSPTERYIGKRQWKKRKELLHKGTEMSRGSVDLGNRMWFSMMSST